MIYRPITLRWEFEMRFFAALMGVVALLQGTMAAAEAVPVELEDIVHAPAELVVSGANGEVSYDPASLEALGARRMVTVTPWREEPATFDGVLLEDILAANGLHDVSAIRVIAENDYAVVIEAAVWKRWPLLVATRVDGRPHSRRARGPIQFVLPMSVDATSGLDDMVNNWVWMAARIEVAD